jgi:hypothetical protein
MSAMTKNTLVIALFLNGVFSVVACSKPERNAEKAVGTTGGTATATDTARHTTTLTENQQAWAKVRADEARRLGIDAVVYGYPLVLVDVTKRVQTNVATPEHNGRAPINQFSNFLKYPTAAYRDVVRMNVDTLYSFAWLDLAKEPIVLSVPDTNGRYYLMPVLDGWTDVFASPGKRTTGTKAGEFLVVGPKWLSAFGKPYTPPAGLVDSQVDMKTPPVEQVARMSDATFFNTLARLMASNPPAAADAPMVANLARIGIVSGRAFDVSALEPAVAKALEGSVQRAVTQIAADANEMGAPVNGWRVPPLTLGNFGTDYPLRAQIALFGIGANLPKDAIYPTAFVDGKGQGLNGANRYTLHFEKGNLPPANAFWSLTMYDAQSFLAANPINRYNIAGWMPLTYNQDGSLDVYIQHNSPGTPKESNWLPAPAGRFSVTLRVYWPKESMLDGSWKPPAIQKVGTGTKGTSGN